MLMRLHFDLYQFLNEKIYILCLQIIKGKVISWLRTNFYKRGG